MLRSYSFFFFDRLIIYRLAYFLFVSDFIIRVAIFLFDIDIEVIFNPDYFSVI